MHDSPWTRDQESPSSQRQKSKGQFPGAGGGRVGGLGFDGYRVSDGEDEEVLETGSGDGAQHLNALNATELFT